MSDLDQVSRLLVRVPNWVGDVVHGLPAIAALRARFPHAEMTVLARGEAGSILSHHPAVDRVMSYPAGRGLSQLRVLRATADRLRQASCDLGVLLTNSFESAGLFRWAGIPRRYGYNTDGRGWLLTDPQPCHAETRRLHQADYYLQLLSGLGIAARRSWQRLDPTAEERSFAVERLAAEGWTGDRPLIALCPGAGFGPAKRWPVERYGALAVRLVGERGAAVMVLGGAAERSMGQFLSAHTGSSLIDVTGRTNLREAMALLALATAAVSNDSGLLHLAAAVGTPVVALFGPTNPDRTGPTVAAAESTTILRWPVSCSPCELRECPIDHRCMAWLEPDAVYEAVCRHLGAPGPPKNAEASRSQGRLWKSHSRDEGSIPVGASRIQTGRSCSGQSGLVVFLDRDGTLNRDVGYLCDPDQVVLLPGVGGALRALREAGARTVIVTNQSGVARGLLTESRLELVHQRLLSLLAAEGVSVDGIFYCPHHPDDRCRCRKPGTELIERARARLLLDSGRSYVVGDKLADVQLAHRIGATAILVRTGHGEQALHSWPDGEPSPDYVADDLQAAANWMLSHWHPVAAGLASDGERGA
ncbi:MAG TPA: lipopolysaccharide heptosyltransferase II [Nitrospiria bacterium]|nr:lipopolysaccharide heptosyltransferase II [Nitrospiria bacterium]